LHTLAPLNFRKGGTDEWGNKETPSETGDRNSLTLDQIATFGPNPNKGKI